MCGGARLGQLMLVEVAMIGVVQVNHPSGATAYLRDKVTGVGEHAQNRLARQFDQVHLTLVSGPAIQIGEVAQQSPLSGAHVEVKLEPASQDPNLVAITLTVRWPAIKLDLTQLSLPPMCA